MMATNELMKVLVIMLSMTLVVELFKGFMWPYFQIINCDRVHLTFLIIQGLT